jgi:hypothetical protein
MSPLPAATQAVHKFAYGPVLLQRHNLLQEVPASIAAHDHSMLQLIFGCRGSFTPTHTDWYGCDAYVQLVEGEKVWYLAPPRADAVFRQLFDEHGGTDTSASASTDAQSTVTAASAAAEEPEAKRRKPARPVKAVKVSKANKDMTTIMLRHGIHAVHQRAGDILYVPGGWTHAVKNLTDTVAFGGSYLREWNWPAMINYLNQPQGLSKIDTINVIALIDAVNAHVRQAAERDIQRKAEAWMTCAKRPNLVPVPQNKLKKKPKLRAASDAS